MSEWRSVEDQRGIEELMEAFMGFHDSCIHPPTYLGGFFTPFSNYLYLTNAHKIW